MGCTQSKIEHEEAVTRCKDRKQFMKEAVGARNAFASAHSAYSIALKNIGAALSDYGQGEIHDILASNSAAAPPPPDPLPPPPPPLPNYPPPPLQRAASMPEFAIPKPDPKFSDTIEEEDEDDEETDTPDNNNLHLHRRGGGRGREEEEVVAAAAPQPPPSPPSPPRAPPTKTNPPPPPPPVAKDSTWDYFFNVDMPGPSLNEPETESIRPDKEEDQNPYGGGELKRSGNVGGSESSGSKVESKEPEKVIETEVAKPVVKKAKPVVQMNTGVPVEAKRVVSKIVPNTSLLEILNKLDDKFLKASESAHEVSKLLEANRMHYHSNFADNRGYIDHSARLMRVITWNRSFRGLQNTEDVNEDVDANETLATVLDKLLAWEKKLYDEVKAAEHMKLEYQQKVASLNKRMKHGKDSEALDRAKSAVGHLHTRYIVDMQSMDSTVSEISRLRDEHLYPKLNALVDGMARMWGSMSEQHRDQMKIVDYLKYLDVSQTPMETSEEHHKRTFQLWAVAEEWHSYFQKLVTHQKVYIQALNSWLKLNIIPIESSLKEKVSSPPRVERPPIQTLLIAWHDILVKLPEDLARGSISSFAAIMKHIMVHQEEEVKLKKKCEGTRQELTRKTQEFEEWYHHKYLKRMNQPDENGNERTEDLNGKDTLGEKEFVIESLKKRLEEEMEAHQKQCRQVREKSLGSLKSHLPELFRAMSDFSSGCSDMYKRLHSISQAQKEPESLS